MDADDETGGRVSPEATDPSSLAQRAVRRQTPEVGAECPNWARSGSVRGVLRNERPYRECENSAARQAQPEFRGLWASIAEKIAKFHSPRGRREHPIEFSHGLQDLCTLFLW